MNSDPDDTRPDDPFQKQREELVALLANKGLVTPDDFSKVLSELALEDQFGPIRELVARYAEGREQVASGLTLRNSVSTWRFDINKNTGDLTLRVEPADRGQLQIPGTLAIGSRFGTIPPPETSAESHLDNGLAVGAANGKPIELVAEGSGPLALEIVAVTDASEVPDYSERWLGPWRRKFMSFTGWGLMPQTVLHAIATRAGEGGRPAIQITPRRHAFAWGALIVALGYWAIAFLFDAYERWTTDPAPVDPAPTDAAPTDAAPADDAPAEGGSSVIEVLERVVEDIEVALNAFVEVLKEFLAISVPDWIGDSSSGLIPFALALVFAGLVFGLVWWRRRRSLRLRWRRTSRLLDYPAEYKLEISGGHSKSDAPKIRCHITQLWS